jgi:hypothetical protein
MKPKVRPYERKSLLLGWVCRGYKGNVFHCSFGETWWDACKQWHETEPKAYATKERSPDLSDDIPF